MEVDRRPALRAGVFGWPVALFPQRAAAPRSRYELSAAGRWLSLQIVIRRSLQKFAWVGRDRATGFEGWTAERRDAVQIEMGRWEIAQLRDVSSQLRRLGL